MTMCRYWPRHSFSSLHSWISIDLSIQGHRNHWFVLEWQPIRVTQFLSKKIDMLDRKGDRALWCERLRSRMLTFLDRNCVTRTGHHNLFCCVVFDFSVCNEKGKNELNDTCQQCIDAPCRTPSHTVRATTVQWHGPSDASALAMSG